MTTFKSCWWYLKPLKTWISLLFTYQWQGQTQTLQFPFLMATHSCTLAWKIPWTEEPGRWQSMGSHRVGHDWATSLSLFTFMRWRRKGNPLQCSFLENPRDGRAWWAAVYGVTQSWTRLKGLSSSSTNIREWRLLEYYKSIRSYNLLWEESVCH